MPESSMSFLRKRTPRLPAWSGTVFLVVLLIAGCAASPSRLVSPSAATHTPTLAPSPTALARGGAAKSDASTVLREAVGRHAGVKTAGGRIGLEIRDEVDAPGEPITTTIEFEYAKPNIRLTARQHPSAPPRAEMILTNEATYFKAENKWLATTPGTRPTEIKLLGLDTLTSFLATATNPRLMTPREVGGVFSDVVGFDLSPEKVQELADLAAFKRAARDGVTIDGHEAEVALGAEDNLIRQMSLVVRGRDRGGSKRPFVQRVVVDLWDFNAPGISVQAPAPGDLLDIGGLLAPTDTAGLQ